MIQAVPSRLRFAVGSGSGGPSGGPPCFVPVWPLVPLPQGFRVREPSPELFQLLEVGLSPEPCLFARRDHASPCLHQGLS